MKPEVSVCCATYNHEPYIRKALDGVVNQITNFEFEIIIGEDCSTDNSRKVLNEYKEKYPDIITLIYRERNVGAKKNFEEVYSKARGKYIIVLETDDYWTDYHKLQIQFDYLESNKDVIAVAHPSIVINENGNMVDYKYPSISEGVYSHFDFRKGLLPGQTTSIMHRNIYRDTSIDKSLIETSVKGAGDKRKIFTMLYYGKIVCLNKQMAVYRYVKSGGSSFVANHGKTTQKDEIEYYLDFVNYAHNLKDKELTIDAEFFYVKTVLSAFKRKQIKFGELLRHMRKVKYFFTDLQWIIKLSR